MSNKKVVQAELKINSKQYEEGLKKASKTTQNENKKIVNSNNTTSRQSQASSKSVILANNSTAQSYGTLRITASADLEKIRRSLQTTASSSGTVGRTISNNNNTAGQSFDQLGRQASQGTNTASSALNSISGVASSVSSAIRTSMSSAGQAFIEFGNNAEAIKKTIREVGDGIVSAGESIKKVGDGITKKVTLPLAGVATGAIAVESNFEYSFAKVSTLLNLSGKDLQKYKKKMAKEASDMGVPLADYAESVYQAISAGQDYGQAIEFVGKNVKLAKGGFTDTTTAVNTTTTVLNTYGKKAGDITQISDKLIAVQNKGKTNVNELGSALADVIPTANSAGLQFNELAGSFAHLTIKGISTAKAGTMMRAMLDELGKSGTKSSDALKKHTGKTFEQLMKDGKSLTDVLKIVEKEAKETGLSIGDMFGSTEASGAVKTILGDLDTFNDSVKAVADSAGATEGAYSKMAGTMKEKMTKAMVGIEKAMAGLGEKLSPAFDMVIEFIDKIPELIEGINFESAIKPFLDMFLELGEKLLGLIKWFSELDPKIQDFIVKSIGVMAVLGPVISLIGQIVMFAGILTIALSGPLGGALAGIATFIGSTLLPVLGSLLGALGGVLVTALPWILLGGIIVGVGYLIMKNWDSIKEALNNFSDAIGRKVTEIKDWFVNGWNAIKDKTNEIFDKVIGGISQKIENAKNKVKAGIDAIKNFFNFEWSLPKLKVPKFNIIGKFDLVPPDISFPTIDVSWHAKGGIFTRPTLFNTPGGVHGVGEAGPEAILPLKKLPGLLGLDKKGSGDMNFNFYDTNINGYNDLEQLSKELGMLMRRKTV